MARHWFELDSDRLIATGVAVGPIIGAQHGAAVAAVVARAVDAVPSPVPMDIVRLTIDLSRRVPMGVTETRVNVRRAGERVQVVEVTLLVDGVECGRSEGMRMRRAAIIDPAEIRPDVPPVFDRSTHLPQSPWGDSEFMESMDITFEHYGSGRAAYWLRLSDHMVAGETMTPATRAAAVADVVLTGGKTYPNNASLNADLTLSMHRLPVGEWFRIDAMVRANPGGWGTSVGTLADLQGDFGYVTKSVLYDEPLPGSHY
ncbi:MAG: thioesterase family protein [Actinomycetota bacterium]|nr:thioesterase family protein [Actinomycetota bacterium]